MTSLRRFDRLSDQINRAQRPDKLGSATSATIPGPELIMRALSLSKGQNPVTEPRDGG
ncbi:MAG: hypothetical protein FD159_322 [Syntrophaceae bacterium]|nr:MAG: hypothetical protein FD159_322 [Syntrophaceae bacterium]